MWQNLSNLFFFASSCFPRFSQSRFFRVQVFHGPGFSEPRFFRVHVFQGPGPGFGSRVWVQVLEVALKNYVLYKSETSMLVVAKEYNFRMYFGGKLFHLLCDGQGFLCNLYNIQCIAQYSDVSNLMSCKEVQFFAIYYPFLI